MQNNLFKKILLNLEFIVIFLIFLFLNLMPIKFVTFLGSLIFRTLGPLTKTQKIVKKNLSKIFPEKSNAELKKESILGWSNTGKTFFELLILPKITRSKNKIVIEGKKILDELINNKEKAIFIGIHQSNWEILVPAIDKIGVPLVGIYRHINNPYINKLILQIRKKSLYSDKSFYTPKGKKSAKDIIEGIINNNSIILLVDQRDSAGQIINFFNFPTKTQTGFIKIAKKYNMKIIPVENIRNLNNTFTLKFHAPINTLENQLSENELMLEIHKRIESWIIKNPTNWFLQHNRFN